MSTIDLSTRRVPPLGGFNGTIARMELRRMMRNRRTVIFTLVMPVVFFLLFGVNEKYGYRSVGHGNVTAYVMVSMAIYGAMIATTSMGASVSLERSLGWSRQLRLTPLAPAAYIAVKLVLALVVGAASILAVYAAGVVTNKADMPIHLWVETGLVAWAGSLAFAAFGLFMGYLLPSENVMQILGPGLALLAWACALVFAAFGLFMGYLLPSENVMQILGPVLAVLSFAGGLFVPVDQLGTTFATIAKFTPVYGVGEIARYPLTHDGNLWLAALNVVVWTALFAGGAMWRFRRDTARV